MRITSYIGIHVSQRTRREAIWTLLGILIWHPIWATKALWQCFIVDAENVHFIVLDGWK